MTAAGDGLTSEERAWVQAHIRDLLEQKTALLGAYREPYCVLVNPDHAPASVTAEGSVILGIPVIPSGVDKPTIATRETYAEVSR